MPRLLAVLVGLVRATVRGTEHLLRMAVPVLGLAAFHEARSAGWIDDASWILVITAALLVPFVALQRRATDALSVVLLLVAGGLGFALAGDLALSVLAIGWLIAACLSARLVDAVQVGVGALT